MIPEEAVKWLDNLTQDIGQMRHQDLWDYAQALSFISQMIDEMPDIVKCKDCMHYKRGWCLNEELPIYGDDATTFEPDEDFWCKYGERRGAE